MGITKDQFINGASWKIIGDFSVKGITFLVSIVLMRLLLAEDYGVLALTNVFTSLSDLLVEGGFSTALIRKEKVDSSDYGSVLCISGIIATVLYTVIFFVAPFAAKYYNEPLLTPVLRVIGLTLFFQSITCIRTAIVNRNMQFKLLSFCNAIGSVISGIIGIIAAYAGLGVWALVIQRLSQMLITNSLLFLRVKVKISIRIDFKRMKELFKFSIGVVGASLLNYFGGSLYSIVIGKRYSVAELGYYDKGSQLPMQLSLYTFGSMSSVLLPTLASYQNDLAKIKSIARKVVKMTAYLIFPMMIGLLLTSREVTVLLFSEKWIPSVPMMRSFCIYYLATPFMLINVQVFFALGHSFLRVKTEIIRLVMMIVSLILVAFILKLDVSAVAITMAIVAVLSSLVTFIETRRLISYYWKEVIIDIVKPIVATTIMGTVIYVVDVILIEKVLCDLGLIPSLGIKVIAGVITYFAMSFVLKIQELGELLALVKRIIKRKTDSKDSERHETQHDL